MKITVSNFSYADNSYIKNNLTIEIQIWLMKNHQYGISAHISQKLFHRKTSGGIMEFQLFSQANPLPEPKTSEYTR